MTLHTFDRRVLAALVAASLALAVGATEARQAGGQTVSKTGLRPAVMNFVKLDAPLVALTNARVIDGTGGPARENQTIVITGRQHRGDRRLVRASQPPEGATVIDLTGKSVIPGLVMVHEHLYYPTGPGVYGQLGAELLAPLSRRRRDDDEDGRQRERLHGHQLEAADRGRAAARPGDRCDRAVPERPEHVPADAAR